MKLKKKYLDSIKLYLIVGTCAVIAVYLIKSYEDNERSHIINGFHKFTIGKFKDVHMTGIGSSLYIELSYEVNGKIYYQSVNSGYYYSHCSDHYCWDKKFWIMYSVDDPSRSLVDISREIQNIKNPSLPEDFDNFK